MARSFALGGVRWWPAARADPAAVRDAAGSALAALASGRLRNQKSGRRKELYFLALGAPGGAPDHLLKVNHYPALVGLRRRLLASKSRRELALAEALTARGVATPVPLAAGERRARGRVVSCYLLVPIVRGARDLRRVAGEGRLAPSERRALASAFGAFARCLHDAGVWQGDFQPNNFLLGPGGPSDLLVVDFERVRLRRALAPADRAAMLAKLERELPHATLADRARFLRAYAGSDRSAARAVWRDVAAAVRALAARDAARLARMARPRGRRFASFAANGWRGLRDAGVRAEELERLPQAAAEALDLDRAVKAGELDAHLARVRAALYPSGAGVVVEATAGTHFAVAVRARRAGARRAFALALVLHRRGLAPRPVALLRRRGHALLVFEGRSPEVFEDRSPNPFDDPDSAHAYAALPAVTGLAVRVLALGALRAAPPPQLVARTAPGAPVGAALLAPWLLEPGRGTGLPDRRLGRRLAQRILGLAQDGRSDPLRAAPGAPAGTERALPDR